MTKSSFLAALLVLWAGLILGVSFISAPMKFLAPHITRGVALEVGRVTFSAFNKIEWVICLAVVALTVKSRKSCSKRFMALSLSVLLLAQTFWLLPELDARAARIIAMGTGDSGIAHWFYVIADILKVALTLTGAYKIGKGE